MLEGVETQDNLPKSKRAWSPRRRRRLLAAFLILGLLGFLCLDKFQKRKEIVSLVDPVSGYRCRFTLNASWKDEGRLPDWHADVLEYEGFTPPQPNAIVRWIQKRLLPHSPKVSGTEEILLAVAMIQDPKSAPLRNGYPPPLTLGKGTVVAERHFMVDGCRASEYTFLAAPETPWIHRKTFDVCTPDLKSAYVLVTRDFIQGDQVDGETDAIIRSFHVEKPVKAGNRR